MTENKKRGRSCTCIVQVDTYGMAELSRLKDLGKISIEAQVAGQGLGGLLNDYTERKMAVFCDQYCKYPVDWDEETQGDMIETVCSECPMMGF